MDTKLLRQKILDLAIHGKLVPQNPADEPASALLERIKAEKEQLIKKGEIKKLAKTSDVHHYDDVPFEIPSSWEWTIVSEISTSILYGVSESAKAEGNYKLLRITDIQDNRVDWDSVPFTEFEENKAISYLLQNNDILFARTGATVGKSYLVRDLTQKAIYASYLIRVQTSKMVLPSYVKFFFESGYYWNQIGLKSIGIGQPNVNGTILGDLSIPIPPLSEQHRIVTEIEKWFSLIDIIESSKNDLQSTIKQTKSKILDLAIHGKLVPQNPKDEPAIELLKRINPKAEISCDNALYPFEVPNNWLLMQGKSIFAPMRSTKPTANSFLYVDIDSIDNRLNTSHPKLVETYLAPSRASRYTEKGDVLFSMVRPYLRNIAMIESNNCIASTGFYVCHSNGSILPKYCLNLMLSDYVVNGLNQFMKGDNSPSINKSHIDSFIFPIPPLPEQQRIVTKIEELFAVIDNIQKLLEA